MVSEGARRLNDDARKVRRARFKALRVKFLLERPGENPFKLIAKEELVSVWTVYDVLRGRR
jgi:hypothetical protein